jgi:hypothetical protein
MISKGLEEMLSVNSMIHFIDKVVHWEQTVLLGNFINLIKRKFHEIEITENT